VHTIHWYFQISQQFASATFAGQFTLSGFYDEIKKPEFGNTSRSNH